MEKIIFCPYFSDFREHFAYLAGYFSRIRENYGFLNGISHLLRNSSVQAEKQIRWDFKEEGFSIFISGSQLI